MRIISVGGGKGGILKTGTAQAIAAYLDRQNQVWTGADTDQENKIFADVYPGVVKPFEVYDTEAGRLRTDQINALVEDIDRARNAKADAYILDQGAGQANVLRGAMTETGMLAEVQSGAIAMTIVFVTLNSDAALTILAQNLESTFTDVPSVRWIIAANEIEDTLDSKVATVLANDGPMQSLIRKRNAKVIRIPFLDDKTTMASWRNTHKSLAEFERIGSFAERGRIKQWSGTIFSQFDTVKDAFLNPHAAKKNALPTVAAN